MYGDFDEDEIDDAYDDGGCPDCGAGSDENCTDDCVCEDCFDYEVDPNVR